MGILILPDFGEERVILFDFKFGEHLDNCVQIVGKGGVEGALLICCDFVVILEFVVILFEDDYHLVAHHFISNFYAKPQSYVFRSSRESAVVPA